MTPEETIQYLLADPERLLQKKPFTRGGEMDSQSVYSALYGSRHNVGIGDTQRVRLPRMKKRTITQEQYLMELDPECHKVLFDQNIPSITQKLNNGHYVAIEYKRMALPDQRNIKDKHVLHLCGNPMQFTLINREPTEQETGHFATFKQYWAARNQDGIRTKMVDAQMSCGDAGLLYYFDRDGRIKSRLISFMDGFILCPHNDDNGDRVLESVYYAKDGVEYIDSYDDTYMYRYRNDGGMMSGNVSGWVLEDPVLHGFDEIPLITKRGLVPWDGVQSLIETKEVIYNIFMVCQKRHGWGVLYIRGRFEDEGKQIAGAIILNDRSTGQTQGDAKYLTAPDPQGMLDTMQLLDESIQKGSGTTFLLPKDVKMSGDISGIAIQLAQSLDNEQAIQAVIDWQNVADKMCRLFKQGLAKELVNTGIQPTAVTDFEKLNISAKFKAWRPRSDSEYNTMLETLYSNGILSRRTAIQKNTESTPDEEVRVRLEDEEKARKLLEQMQAQAVTAGSQTDTGNGDSGNGEGNNGGENNNNNNAQ